MLYYIYNVFTWLEKGKMGKLLFAKGIIIIALLLGCFIGGPKAYAQMAGVLVYPNVLEMDFSNTSRKFVSRVINVENPTSSMYRVRVYSQDWDMNETGQVLFLDNPVENTISDKIKFNPYEFDLAPGQKQVVRLTAKTPEGDDGEYRTMIFLETVTPKKDILKAQQNNVSFLINFKTRFGVAIYAYKGELFKQVDIKDLDIVNEAESPFIQAKLHSDGNIHSVLRGTLTLYNPDNRENPVYETDVTYTVLPGRTQQLMMTLPPEKVENGDYVANLRLVYKDNEGKEQVLAAEKEVSLNRDAFSTKEKLEKPLTDENVQKTPENIAKPIQLDEAKLEL